MLIRITKTLYYNAASIQYFSKEWGIWHLHPKDGITWKLTDATDEDIEDVIKQINKVDKLEE